MEINAPGIVALNRPRSKIQAQVQAPVSALAQAIPRVYGYFYPRVGGNVALAEDLTQETMLAAVRAGGAPEHHDQQLPWLFHIARNKLIDHYRKEARRRESFGHEVADEAEHLEPGLPDLDLESLPVREEVIETLGRLKPRHRIAIILKYLDGCDTREVAEAMFLSESATTSLLSRARSAFRTIWIERNGDRR